MADKWNEIIVDAPHARLTKQQVHDYYARPNVQSKLLAAVRGRAAIIRQSFDPNRVVLRRKDPKGNLIRMNAQRLHDLNQQRLSEVHQTFGPRVPALVADIDPQENVPWRRTKAIAETVARTMETHPDVQSVDVRFSGGRGFYVQGNLAKPMDVNAARRKTQQILHGIAQRDDVTFGVADKNQVRLDMSPLKNKGSIRAPFSLNVETGLVSMPVKLDDLPQAQKTDFTMAKAVKTAAAEISFPEEELAAYRERLGAGKDITTTRVSDELGRYAAGNTYASPFGPLTAEAVQRVSGIKNHPYYDELTPEQLAELEQYGPEMDIVRLKQKDTHAAERLRERAPDLDPAILEEVKKKVKGVKLPPGKAHHVPLHNKADIVRAYAVLKGKKPDVATVLHRGMSPPGSALPRVKEAIIKEEGGKFVLRTRDGSRVLGTHDTKGEAYAQEAAIQHSKARRKKAAAEEFAPGIPAERGIKPIPEIRDAAWRLAVQEHLARKAGRHYDVRLVDPETHQAHSWAVPKGRYPTVEDRMLRAIQQPTHTEEYARNFSGTIPEGEYGAGDVKLLHDVPTRVQAAADKLHFQGPEGEPLVLFRTQDNQWGFKRLNPQEK